MEQEVTHFPKISCLLIIELNANCLNIMLTLKAGLEIGFHICKVLVVWANAGVEPNVSQMNLPKAIIKELDLWKHLYKTW